MTLRLASDAKVSHSTPEEVALPAHALQAPEVHARTRGVRVVRELQKRGLDALCVRGWERAERGEHKRNVQVLAPFMEVCKMLNISAPLGHVSTRAWMAYLRLPAEGGRSGRAQLAEALGVGPSSLTRYLQELSRWGVVLRVGHGEWAIPRDATRRLLLLEPDAYHREVLLLDDVYRAEKRRAFACVPVRRAIGMEIPHAILVLPLETAIGADPPQVARMRLRDPVHAEDVPVPSDADPPIARASVPCASPLDALSLLASTGDADFIAAAREAAPRLGLRLKALADAVARLKPSDTAKRGPANLVRHPAWLADCVHAARVAAMRRTTRSAVEGREG